MSAYFFCAFVSPFLAPFPLTIGMLPKQIPGIVSRVSQSTTDYAMPSVADDWCECATKVWLNMRLQDMCTPT